MEYGTETQLGSAMNSDSVWECMIGVQESGGDVVKEGMSNFPLNRMFTTLWVLWYGVPLLTVAGRV